MTMPNLNVDTAINFLYTIYYFLRSAIITLLEATLFKAEPDAALLYGDSITMLTTITAIYIILEFFTTAKRIVKIILILGWVFLIISLFAGKV